jgi:hypothetical protein
MVLFYDHLNNKEQIESPENDHATRKSHGHIDSVRASGFLICKTDPPNLYKFESAKESDKWYLNDWLEKVMFYSENLYTLHKERTNCRPENDHATRKSHGHIDWIWAFGLYNG